LTYALLRRIITYVHYTNKTALKKRIDYQKLIYPFFIILIVYSTGVGCKNLTAHFLLLLQLHRHSKADFEIIGVRLWFFWWT